MPFESNVDQESWLDIQAMLKDVWAFKARTGLSVQLYDNPVKLTLGYRCGDHVWSIRLIAVKKSIEEASEVEKVILELLKTSEGRLRLGNLGELPTVPVAQKTESSPPKRVVASATLARGTSDHSSEWWIAAPDSDAAQLILGKGFDFDGHVGIDHDTLCVRRRDDEDEDVQKIPVSMVLELLKAHGKLAL